MNVHELSPLVLVSGNPSFRDRLMDRFEGVLWKPLCFSSCEEARPVIAAERPPVVVSDREWDELLALASQLDPPPLVVAVCPTIESFGRALRAGVYDAVVEPFDPMEPIWTIACALNFAAGRAAGREGAPCGAA